MSPLRGLTILALLYPTLPLSHFVPSFSGGVSNSHAPLGLWIMSRFTAICLMFVLSVAPLLWIMSRLTAICLGRVSISAGEGGGGLRGAVLSLTPHDLQIETQTGVCAYCFLVLSSRNEYIPDGPVNDAEWAAHQVSLTLSSILLTFCNTHRPQSPSSTSSSPTPLPVSISHSF